jgi:hypothetical protein
MTQNYSEKVSTKAAKPSRKYSVAELENAATAVRRYDELMRVREFLADHSPAFEYTLKIISLYLQHNKVHYNPETEALVRRLSSPS